MVNEPSIILQLGLALLAEGMYPFWVLQTEHPPQRHGDTEKGKRHDSSPSEINRPQARQQKAFLRDSVPPWWGCSVLVVLSATLMAMILLAFILVIVLAVLGLPRFRSGTAPAVGGMAPDFSLAAQDGSLVRPADYRGRWVLLYFYPKDKTPG